MEQEEGGLDMCKAFEDERAEGKAEGKAEGAFAMLCSLVKKGLLKIEDAAMQVNMTEEMFCKKMQEMK